MNGLRALAEAMGCPEDGFWRPVALSGGVFRPGHLRGWRPAVAIRREPEGLTVLIDVRAVSWARLSLSAAGRTLALFSEPRRGSGRRKSGAAPLRGLRTVGRLVTLPAAVSASGARATLAAGLLRVTLPRRGRRS